MYVFLRDSKVYELIPDINPELPGVPIQERYPSNFVDMLIHVPDDTELEQGWVYDADIGKFSAPPAPDIEPIRAAKEAELSAACNAAIVAGVDVETTQGAEHFSLTETDQINLTTAYNAVLNGATGYPYHADGTMCRMFSADEIKAISEAGIAHIMYHTTLCNHLLTWARRAETIAEIEGISYTAEGMPEDLAANMASVLASAESV